MTGDSPIQTRHDPASHFSRRECRGAFGYFCDEIRRARLTATQRDLALLIAGDTLGSGFLSVLYGRLDDLVLDEPGQPPLLNLAKNDISPALKALNSFGIVRADRVRFDSDTVWLVLVSPNSAQWRMGDRDWRFLPDRLHRRRMHLNAQRRRAARYLAGLTPDVDLYDALAAEAVGTCPASGSDALNESEQTASGRNSLSFDKSDALTVLAPTATIASRSEIQNVKMPMIGWKKPDVPEIRTPLKVSNLPIQNHNVCNLEELKLKLHGHEESDFCMAARQIMGMHDWDDGRRHHFLGDGSKWRLRWRYRPSRQVVVAVFDEMILSGRSGGGYAEDLWKRLNGQALEAGRLKKSKESFSSK